MNRVYVKRAVDNDNNNLCYYEATPTVVRAAPFVTKSTLPLGQ